MSDEKDRKRQRQRSSTSSIEEEQNAIASLEAKIEKILNWLRIVEEESRSKTLVIDSLQSWLNDVEGELSRFRKTASDLEPQGGDSHT